VSEAITELLPLNAGEAGPVLDEATKELLCLNAADFLRQEFQQADESNTNSPTPQVDQIGPVSEVTAQLVEIPLTRTFEAQSLAEGEELGEPLPLEGIQGEGVPGQVAKASLSGSVGGGAVAQLAEVSPSEAIGILSTPQTIAKDEEPSHEAVAEMSAKPSVLALNAAPSENARSTFDTVLNEAITGVSRMSSIESTRPVGRSGVEPVETGNTDEFVVADVESGGDAGQEVQEEHAFEHGWLDGPHNLSENRADQHDGKCIEHDHNAPQSSEPVAEAKLIIRPESEKCLKDLDEPRQKLHGPMDDEGAEFAETHLSIGGEGYLEEFVACEHDAKEGETYEPNLENILADSGANNGQKRIEEGSVDGTETKPAFQPHQVAEPCHASADPEVELPVSLEGIADIDGVDQDVKEEIAGPDTHNDEEYEDEFVGDHDDIDDQREEPGNNENVANSMSERSSHKFPDRFEEQSDDVVDLNGQLTHSNDFQDPNHEASSGQSRYGEDFTSNKNGADDADDEATQSSDRADQETAKIGSEHDDEYDEYNDESVADGFDSDDAGASEVDYTGHMLAVALDGHGTDRHSQQEHLDEFEALSSETSNNSSGQHDHSEVDAHRVEPGESHTGGSHGTADEDSEYHEDAIDGEHQLVLKSPGVLNEYSEGKQEHAEYAPSDENHDSDDDSDISEGDEGREGTPPRREHSEHSDDFDINNGNSEFGDGGDSSDNDVSDSDNDNGDDADGDHSDDSDGGDGVEDDRDNHEVAQELSPDSEHAESLAEQSRELGSDMSSREAHDNMDNQNNDVDEDYSSDAEFLSGDSLVDGDQE